jgi:hypothetical protein
MFHQKSLGMLEKGAEDVLNVAGNEWGCDKKKKELVP